MTFLSLWLGDHFRCLLTKKQFIHVKQSLGKNNDLLLQSTSMNEMSKESYFLLFV